MSNSPLTDKELVKWVSIVRAQKRLPVYIKGANDLYKNIKLDLVGLKRVRDYINSRLEKDRDPKMGELVRVYARVECDKEQPRNVSVELYTADEN